jgi:hypothetical protein
MWKSRSFDTATQGSPSLANPRVPCASNSWTLALVDLGPCRPRAWHPVAHSLQTRSAVNVFRLFARRVLVSQGRASDVVSPNHPSRVDSEKCRYIGPCPVSLIPLRLGNIYLFLVPR